MPRQSILALGLLTLALAAAPPARASSPEPAKAGHDAPAGGHETSGHTTAEPEPNILELKPPLAIATVIVFLLLLGVLGKFAWGPLLAALQKREEHLEHTLAETERARAEAERLMAEHRAQMAQAAEQVRSILDQGRRAAETSAAEILRKAQEEAESARERARREIGSARDQALQEIWTRTADLAVSVAGRVLERELGDDDRRRLVEVAMNELPDRPAGTNGHGGHRA